MKTIHDIYEWSKMNHENIHEFYEDVKNNKNHLESLHRGCAMMAHLRFLSNSDFKELPNRFEEFELNIMDYYHFVEALIRLNIIDTDLVNSSIFGIVKHYRNKFDEIEQKEKKL